jgi:hypothetical protein
LIGQSKLERPPGANVKSLSSPVIIHDRLKNSQRNPFG